MWRPAHDATGRPRFRLGLAQVGIQCACDRGGLPVLRFVRKCPGSAAWPGQAQGAAARRRGDVDGLWILDWARTELNTCMELPARGLRCDAAAHQQYKGTHAPMRLCGPRQTKMWLAAVAHTWRQQARPRGRARGAAWYHVCFLPDALLKRVFWRIQTTDFLSTTAMVSI